jgi:hypothetical protein
MTGASVETAGLGGSDVSSAADVMDTEETLLSLDVVCVCAHATGASTVRRSANDLFMAHLAATAMHLPSLRSTNAQSRAMGRVYSAGLVMERDGALNRLTLAHMQHPRRRARGHGSLSPSADRLAACPVRAVTRELILSGAVEVEAG